MTLFRQEVLYMEQPIYATISAERYVPLIEISIKKAGRKITYVLLYHDALLGLISSRTVSPERF